MDLSILKCLTYTEAHNDLIKAIFEESKRHMEDGTWKASGLVEGVLGECSLQKNLESLGYSNVSYSLKNFSNKRGAGDFYITSSGVIKRMPSKVTDVLDMFSMRMRNMLSGGRHNGVASVIRNMTRKPSKNQIELYGEEFGNRVASTREEILGGMKSSGIVLSITSVGDKLHVEVGGVAKATLSAYPEFKVLDANEHFKLHYIRKDNTSDLSNILGLIIEYCCGEYASVFGGLSTIVILGRGNGNNDYCFYEGVKALNGENALVVGTSRGW